MKTYQNYSLQKHNTFALPAICPAIYFPTSREQLAETCLQVNQPFYVLGEGSNTLFLDETTPVIIKPDIKGIWVTEREGSFLIKAGSGENWHNLVSFCVEHNYGGLENLALIPGSVGAAPVQNIGAYGVELSDVIEQVSWFEFESRQVHSFDKKACRFAYRESIFKKALFGKGIIIDVTLSLPKKWQPQLTYSGLDKLGESVCIKDIYQKVITIRQAKLPDPQVLPNCGSFFKNPVVSQMQYQALEVEFGEMPAYPQKDGKVKLAAGWLIDKAGFKGFRENKVGVHDLQALVIVNYGTSEGKHLANLAKKIQKAITHKFGIALEAEVRVLSSDGLVLLESKQAGFKF